MAYEETPTWCLWAKCALAMICFNLDEMKILADAITRRQKGKVPGNHGNWGG